MKSIFFLFFLFPILFPILFFGQNIEKDSISELESKKQLTFNHKQLIISVALCTYGVIAIESDYLKSLNSEISEEVKEHIDKKITIDDFSQYAPLLAVYGLNAIGIQGKNNLRDRSIIMGTSYLFMSTTIMSLKKITSIERPDGTSKNSFPSGHTATAFAGAEFLWQEYKDVNIWYGISGFVVATGTGLFRMYNNRHWLSDVIMGAGIGVLSTKIAYWIYPFVDKHIFRSKKDKSSAMIAPFYNGKQVGLGLLVSLK
ncbi:MAG: phosphatase PAP2 family protein [Flavobacterium sp.]|nr:MAG: phosphatase PAP2 family protein [Flavobacterium sp.]